MMVTVVSTSAIVKPRTRWFGEMEKDFFCGENDDNESSRWSALKSVTQQGWCSGSPVYDTNSSSVGKS